MNNLISLFVLIILSGLSFQRSAIAATPANDCSDGQFCCYAGPAGRGWWTPQTLNANINGAAACSGSYSCCTAARVGSTFQCLPNTGVTITRKLVTIGSGNWVPVPNSQTCGAAAVLSCPLDLNRCNDNSGGAQVASCNINDTDINTITGTVHAEISATVGGTMSAEVPCVGGVSANTSVTATAGGSYSISGTQVVSINFNPSESVSSCDAVQGTKEYIKRSGTMRYTMDGFQVCRFAEVLPPGSKATPRTYGQTMPINSVLGVGSLSVTGKRYEPAGEGPAAPGCFRRGCGPGTDCASQKTVANFGSNCMPVYSPPVPPTVEDPQPPIYSPNASNPPPVGPTVSPVVSPGTTNPVVTPGTVLHPGTPTNPFGTR